eukprot:NODE_248_length_12985_cov_0.286357.p10 type:complete len:112 gc:universal NODE_248_length_12985_cov_0.286357:4591-4926(+)
MGVQRVFPCSSFHCLPGSTSISSPMRNTPHKMDPPAIPPTTSQTSVPGLFTSKLRITIILAGDCRSRIGRGMYFRTHSFTASTLYFNWAEIGITGDPLAHVPLTNSLISLY